MLCVIRLKFDLYGLFNWAIAVGMQKLFKRPYGQIWAILHGKFCVIVPLKPHPQNKLLRLKFTVNYAKKRQFLTF